MQILEIEEKQYYIIKVKEDDDIKTYRREIGGDKNTWEISTSVATWVRIYNNEKLEKIFKEELKNKTKNNKISKDSDFYKFIQIVLNKENLKDWRVEWGVPPSECIDELKLIRISDFLKNNLVCYQCELFLHEVAHIGIETYKHNTQFYKNLSKLFDKYGKYIPK